MYSKIKRNIPLVTIKKINGIGKKLSNSKSNNLYISKYKLNINKKLGGAHEKVY